MCTGLGLVPIPLAGPCGCGSVQPAVSWDADDCVLIGVRSCARHDNVSFRIGKFLAVRVICAVCFGFAVAADNIRSCAFVKPAVGYIRVNPKPVVAVMGGIGIKCNSGS